MFILFVDDSSFRWRKFSDKIDGDDTAIWAKTAQEAIQFMDSSFRFGLIMLDHSLSDAHYETDCIDDTTGFGIARWIVKHKDNFSRTMFVAHTLNPDGAAGIQFILSQAGFQCEWIPSAWKKINLDLLPKQLSS